MVCSGGSLRVRLCAIAVGTGLAVGLTAQTSHAQTFPQNPQWIPFTCNGQTVTDLPGEVQPPAIDVVGDAANPAAYFYMDNAYLYLRLRMNTTTQNAGTFDPYAWACLLRPPNTNGYVAWDGINGLVTPNDVELLQNTQPQPGNPRLQPANKVVATYPTPANSREVAATSNLGGNPNVFVEWAVPLSDLAKVGITPGTPMTFICGTSKTQRILDADIVGVGCPGFIYDPAYCPGGNCETCNTTRACGPSCSACSGAASVCNPAYGCYAQCTRDNQCGGATPYCDQGRGLCVGCTSNATCANGTTCDTASGFCIGCTANNACSAGTYCDTASGICTPCTGGAATCTGPGGASSGGTGGSGGSAGIPDKIEGGACACDAVGNGSSPGAAAALALGIASALRMRRRRRR